MKYSSSESEYLTELLKSALKGTAVPCADDSIDWQMLVDLAVKQQVYSIIAPILSDTNIPKEQMQALEVQNKNELIRLIAMKNELEEIKLELLNNGIDFMLVKGSVIRDYYPQQKMRQMSDIDILYKAENQGKLISIMKNRGYHLETAAANSDDFFKPPFYSFEFHRQIFDENDAFHPDFDLWERAYADAQNPCEYHISKEDIFIYSLCHMYDHYSLSGCGIRFVCDIYVLLKELDNLDWDYINSTFVKFGFNKFCETAIGLARSIFMNKQETACEQELFDFIMTCGVYGKSLEITELIENKYNGSRLKYVMHRLFPPKSVMVGNYIQLRKRPYLLPAYYVIRIVQKLTYKRKSIKQEISKLK